MKKIRKSLVILPALATMALTTVASVTGTVAWFTANKGISATASSFAANYNDGNLSLVASSVQAGSANESGNSTAVVTIGNDQKTVSVVEGKKLTDASYDATSDKLWSDTVAGDGTQPTTFVDKGAIDAAATGWVATSDGADVYAITWKYNFTYQFGSDTTPVDLFFQPGTSTMTAGTNGTFDGVAGGFRISMKTTNSLVVYAPSSASDIDGNKYIKDASGATGTYTLTHETDNTDTSITEKEDHSKNTLYLGQFTTTSANASATLEVNLVAWFEGTDPHVVTGKSLDAVSASLAFTTVKGVASASTTTDSNTDNGNTGN